MTHNYELTRKWLKKMPLVVTGYRDPVRGVNLFHLLHLWRECWLDGDAFSEVYPYAADHFQVKVADKETTLGTLLPKFKHCHYLQCWYNGSMIVLPPQD
jgi:hypothetical protein